MSKEKIYLIIIGSLVVMNLGLSYILFKQLSRGNMRPDDDKIQKMLGFDDEQMETYFESRRTHHTNILIIQDELKLISKSYYLTPLNDSTARDSIKNELEIKTNELYQLNDKHFDEVSSLYKPGQKNNKEKLINFLITNGPVMRK
jgi:hypothetical protein